MTATPFPIASLRDIDAVPPIRLVDADSLADHPAFASMPDEFDQVEPPAGPEPIDWAALASRAPPPLQWVAPGLIPAGPPTLLSGPGGVGKTLVAQTIGAALSVDCDYLGRPGRPLNVGAWFCEDPMEEIWRRQVDIAAHFDQPLSAFKRLHIVPRVGCDNLLFGRIGGDYAWTRGMREIEEMVCDLRLDVFILDNVAQTCEDEIARSPVTRFVNRFAGLGKAAGLNTTALLLAHPAKSLGSEFSGSTAWENACRSRLLLTASPPDQKANDEDDTPTDDNMRFLATRKANYSRRGIRTLTYTNGVLVPDPFEVGESAFTARMREQRAETTIMEAFDSLVGKGLPPTNGSSSPHFLPKLMVDLRYNNGFTKKDLTRAMNRLIATDRLRRDVIGQHANRTPKYGLVKV